MKGFYGSFLKFSIFEILNVNRIIFYTLKLISLFHIDQFVGNKAKGRISKRVFQAN